MADNSGKGYVKASNFGLTPDEIYTNHYEAWYNVIRQIQKAPTMYFNLSMGQLMDLPNGPWLVNNAKIFYKRCETMIHNSKGIQPTKMEGFKI